MHLPLYLQWPAGGVVLACPLTLPLAAGGLPLPCFAQVSRGSRCHGKGMCKLAPAGSAGLCPGQRGQRLAAQEGQVLCTKTPDGLPKPHGIMRKVDTMFPSTPLLGPTGSYRPSLHLPRGSLKISGHKSPCPTLSPSQEASGISPTLLTPCLAPQGPPFCISLWGSARSSWKEL